ncbi:MAG: hypothetical protein HC914_05280 [Chloroflexaceae bacterium]|nr:hypothetical protein [Chloroflexaceae bacterium]
MIDEKERNTMPDDSNASAAPDTADDVIEEQVDDDSSGQGNSAIAAVLITGVLTFLLGIMVGYFGRPLVTAQVVNIATEQENAASVEVVGGNEVAAPMLPRLPPPRHPPSRGQAMPNAKR